MENSIKYLLVSVLFIFALSSFSQENSNVSSESDNSEYVTDSKIEKIADKYIEKTVDGLGDTYKSVKTEVQLMAESLKQPVENVLGYYIKYHIARALTPIIMMILFLSLFFTGVIINNNIKRRGDDNDTGFAVSLVSGIIFILTFFGALLDESIPRLITPEYYVIQDIIEVFK